MKKNYTFIFFISLFIYSSTLNAQTTLFATIDGPYGMATKDNFLYVTALDKIYKLDMSIENPTPIEVVSGINGGDNLIFNGNDLYVSEFAANKISKIDITANNPVIIDVVNNVINPTGIAFNGNDLYIAELGANKISKIDITQTNPTTTDVITNIGYLFGLAINGDELFYSLSAPSKLSKINLTQTNPIPVDIYTDTHIYNMTFEGNDLYMANTEGRNILKIDVSQSDLTPLNVVSVVGEPLYIAINGSDLYISFFLDDRIEKFDLNSLNVNEFNASDNIKIYPNPTVDFVNVSGVSNDVVYKIYDIIGQNIINGKIDHNSKIDLTNLESGIYFIQIDSSNPLKIIKK